MDATDVEMLPPPHPYRFALYRIFDDRGKLLYVGISNSVMSRLESHAGATTFFHRATVIHIQRFESRTDARHAEQRAILREKPLFNIQDTKIRRPRKRRGDVEIPPDHAFGYSCRVINDHFDEPVRS